ncbi:MAG: DUF2026 family protein, partial [Nitrosomonas sp.]|nr:DUF2026 family protein [Nitrosomonas sp.]
SGVSYDCNQDLQSSFGVTWRIYEVVRKIYYLKLQDLFSVSLAWYAKPPKKLPTGVSVKDDEGRIYLLKPIGPEITGVW